MYLLSSNHTVWASLDESAGTGKYLDPMGLATAGSTHPQTGYMVAYGDSSGHVYPDVSNQEIWVGGSYEDPCYAEPYIRGITTIVNGLTYGAVGSLNGSGTLDISGSTLEDGGCDPNPSVCVNGNCAGNGGQASAGGLTLSNVNALSDDEITLSYSVDGQASSVGPYNITVMNDVGTSNTYQFVVGDPTPVIASVSPPSPWQAANSPLTVTIKGTGFGTSPQLSITGTGVVSASLTGQSADLNTLTASVTLSATGGTGAITVASRGYGGIGGSGFVPSPPSQPSTSNEVDVTVDAEAVPTVQIMFQGQNVANNGNPTCPGAPACVYVGQQIALTAVVQGLPAGTTIQTQTWSQPGGTVVGGYFASAASGCVVPFPNTLGGGCQQPQPCQTLSNSACITFYWVSTGSQTVTYSYTLSDGQNGSAPATFVVAGPSNANVTAPTDVVGIQSSDLSIALGVDDKIGINFTVSAALPPQNQGTYTWVQLVLKNPLTYLTSKLGIRNCTNSVFLPPNDTSPALDTAYPVDIGPTTNDSPETPLQASTPNNGFIGEEAAGASFTMYSMWTPNAASGCTSGPACTIPVPLGTTNWSYSGDAINTLTNQPANGTNWTMAPPGCTLPNAPDPKGPPFAPGSSYPQWHKLINTKTTGNGCQ